MIRDVIYLRTAVIITIISGAITDHVLFRDGCIEKTNFPTGNITDNTSLPNNFPGICVAFCTRNNGNLSHIALKDEECVCFLSSDASFKTTSLVTAYPCSKTCPGHADHVCGGNSDHYSLYKYDNISTVSKDQCVAVHCNGNGGQSVIGTSCNTKLKGYCIRDDKIFKQVHECSLSKTTWSGYSCPTTFMDRQSQLMTSFCNPHGGTTSSLPTCNKATYWIEAFGVAAPPKNCSPVNTLLHGNLTYLYDDQAVVYACNHGYKLTGNARRWCMGNNSWTGKVPSCVSVSTTTSQPPSASSATTTVGKSSSSAGMPTTSPATATVAVTTSGSAGNKAQSIGFTTATSSPTKTPQSGLSVAAIAGICTGAVTGFTCAFAAGLVVWKKYCSKLRHQVTPPGTTASAHAASSTPVTSLAAS